MSAPPDTVLEVDEAEAEAIRNAVRTADPLTLGYGRMLARPEHAAALAHFFADPRVSGAIYDLPRPFTAEVMNTWILESEALRQEGRRLLILTFDETAQLVGYSCITVWPERSAAELAGAIRADRQNEGQGGAGAIHSFGWVFDTLGVRMMGLTAAVDNVRSARLIDAAGFTRMGERDSVRPDGTVRRSLYWEMMAEDWKARWG
ncbi:RimJ/RimL family protein N-acetyltransferase [Caulobacter ginsengisoli]|uniref:RimJ/RimL family protein N-acetyltransferase n=1 Tax=Caulobacter ginsengisoli TaxID=400775 RepID=A0ABU0IXA1_9CAUL|nr:GNAT family protein [Caulobacter ginsengisoli]MDQ0466005.1 RimJ/RimL family protein N-acetyltransferase [Caulobacter ginsengisoli]